MCKWYRGVFFYKNSGLRLNYGRLVLLRSNYGGQAGLASQKTASRGGQALTEIIVAIGIAALFMMAATFTITAVLKSNNTNRNLQTATNLATELMEKAKSLADSKWHGIYDLNKGSSEHYYLVASSSLRLAADSVKDGLVGWWGFDEGDGLAVGDSSGSANNGTLHEAPNWDPPADPDTFWTASPIWGYDHYNPVGRSSHVVINPSVSINNLQKMTLSAWANLTDYGPWQCPRIFDKDRNQTLSAAWLLEMCGPAYGTGNVGTLGTRQNFTDGSQGSWYTPEGYLTTGTWQHVLMTYDRTSISNVPIFYVNGVLAPTVTYSSPVGGTPKDDSGIPLWLGGQRYISSNNQVRAVWNGYLDDVKIYNRIVTAAEIPILAGTSSVPIYFFLATAGDEPLDISSSTFTRYFYVENVNRDAGGNIVSSGGTEDPSTQKITVTVIWPGTTTGISFSEYVTRTGSSVFRQTDWSGGDGQEGPVNNVGNKFSTSTIIDYLTVAGSLAVDSVGLVGYWQMDEGSGTSTADISESGYNGVLLPVGNMPTWTTSGKIAKALIFNGANYVDVGVSSSLSFERTDPFSISAWVNRSAVNNYDPIFAKFRVDLSGWVLNGYILQLDPSNRVQVMLNYDADTGENIEVATAAGTVSTGSWYHVAMTYDGSSAASGVKIYVDGLEKALTIFYDNLSQSIANTSTPRIGGDQSRTPDYFDGTIDDVRVYNRVLSDAEIKIIADTNNESVLVSSIFDTGAQGGAALNSVGWQGDQPSGTSVQFQIATSNNSAGPWNYVGPDGASGSYYSPAGPSIFTPISYQYHGNQRYIRYKANLIVSGGKGPRVDDVIIGWSP